MPRGADHVVGTPSPDTSSAGMSQPDIEMDIRSVHGGSLCRDQDPSQSGKAQHKTLAGIYDEPTPAVITEVDTPESSRKVMSRKDKLLMRWFPVSTINFGDGLLD